MANPVSLSVITPTRNRAHYLRECLHSVAISVLAGLEGTFEHIVLASGDDGQTRRLFDELAGREGGTGPARLIEVPEPLPPGEARNRAIREAKGDWIVLLDDDDLMLQRTLFHFGRATQETPDTRWFISDFVRVDEELRYQPGEDYYGWQFDDTKGMLGAIFRSESFVQGNVCFERALFDEVGGYDPERRTAEDLELYCRFLIAGALPRVLSLTSHLHRVHTSNTSRDIGRDHHFEDLRQIHGKLASDLDRLGVPLDLPG